MFKKAMWLMIMGIWVSLLFSNLGYSTNEQIVTIVVDDKYISFKTTKPWIDKQKRTQAPLRAIADTLGLRTMYHHASKKVTLTDGKTIVVMQVGKSAYTVNGKSQTMDTTPVLLDNRIIIPIRYLAEAYDANVRYVAHQKTVYIDQKKPINNEKPHQEESKSPNKEEPESPGKVEETPKPLPPEPQPVIPVDQSLVQLPIEKTSGCYVVRSIGQLQAAKDDLDGCYVLGNDIDASYTETWNEGKGFEPVGTEDAPFTGTLDGKNYTVNGLMINRPTEKYVGLLNANSSDIKNIHFINATITGDETMGYAASVHIPNASEKTVGVLAGFASETTIENVSVKNSKLSAFLSGGIAGIMSDTQMTEGVVEQLEMNGGFSGGVVAFAVNNTILADIQARDIKEENAYYSGGVVAQIRQSKLHDVQVIDMELSGVYYIGGVVGIGLTGTEIYRIDAKELILRQMNSAGGQAGGVVGGMMQSISDDLSVSNATINADNFAGGVIGGLTESTLTNSNVDGVELRGKSAGGIAGSVIESNVSVGLVKNSIILSPQSSGGITGDVKKSKVSDMDVLKNALSSNVAVGGIFGYDFGDSEVFDNSVIESTLQGDNGAGGIGGSIARTKIHNNTVESITLYAAQRAGGLYGYEHNGSSAGGEIFHNTVQNSSIKGTQWTGAVAGVNRYASRLHNRIVDSHVEGKNIDASGFYGQLIGGPSDESTNILENTTIVRLP